MAIPVVPEASMVGKTGPGKLHSQGVPLIKGGKKKVCFLRWNTALATLYKHVLQNTAHRLIVGLYVKLDFTTQRS